jgi:hypothetical protein
MFSIVSEGEHSISTCIPSRLAKRNLILTVSFSVGVLLSVSLSDDVMSVNINRIIWSGVMKQNE